MSKILHLVSQSTEAPAVEETSDQGDQGELVEQIKVLSASLWRTQDQLRELGEVEARIKASIAPLVGLLGGNLDLPGLAKWENIEPTIVRVYDAGKLDALVAGLIGSYPEVAASIAGCRKEQPRKGSLRITRAKTV